MILIDTLNPFSGTLDILLTNSDESRLYVAETGGRKVMSYDTDSWAPTSVSGQGDNPTNLGFELINGTLLSMDGTLVLGTEDKLFFLD